MIFEIYIGINSEERNMIEENDQELLWASKRAYVTYMYIFLMNKSYQLWPPNIVQFSCFLQNMKEEDIWKIIRRKNIYNIFVPHPSIFVDKYAKYLLQIKIYRYEEVDISSLLVYRYISKLSSCNIQNLTISNIIQWNSIKDYEDE